MLDNRNFQNASMKDLLNEVKFLRNINNIEYHLNGQEDDDASDLKRTFADMLEVPMARIQQVHLTENGKYRVFIDHGASIDFFAVTEAGFYITNFHTNDSSLVLLGHLVN